jgi:hypothetical protein
VAAIEQIAHAAIFVRKLFDRIIDSLAINGEADMFHPEANIGPPPCR